MDEFGGAITVCNTDGIIVYMNDFSIRQFEKYGGDNLLGTNLLECHPEPSKTKLREMLEKPIENTYTTEKNGLKKVVTQKPWMENGKFCGVVELSFELPSDIENQIRT
ncbi:diguanylate cyclase [Draconibacterium halophilum]|uniref:Diguanylate cyclase n=2 Tax=Draconibacterium halophilum TaxID=2706887 RepID=A0A6C0RL03_9BACT|nr:diguanylate cyclase [Draconibacterium halophilum]